MDNQTVSQPSENTQSRNIPINGNLGNSTDNRSSYAAAAERDSFPKKDQAIVIESLPQIPISEYLVEIGRIIGPSNIRFASKISNGRVCMFLASKQVADDLTDKHSSVNIRGHSLELRPLITNYKKLILSNVCPVIPHSFIKSELERIGVQTASEVTFLRAGMSEPGFAHVLSFRRQVYVHPDSVSKIPESLQINFEDTAYWIYLTTNTLVCFLCKLAGHIAKNCKTDSKESSGNLNYTNLNQMSTPPILISQSQDQIERTKNNDHLQFPPLPTIPNERLNSGNKRPLSEASSSIVSDGPPKKESQTAPSNDIKKNKRRLENCKNTKKQKT